MLRKASGILVLAMVIAACVISARSIPATEPAIINASNSYERGGAAAGLIQLRISGLDPSHATILLDGSDRYVDTISRTETSVTGKLHDDTPLGRHTLSVQSGAQRTSEHIVDIIAMHFDPVGVLHTGQVKTVHLTVEGLGKDT